MDRYYQPQNSKDAMRQIEKLFNQYKDAPLTQELADYHQKLLDQMQTQVLPVAKQENIKNRIEAATSMIDIMKRWFQIKMNGKSFDGRMHHFKFEPNNSRPEFKRHNVKINGNSSLRSTRH